VRLWADSEPAGVLDHDDLDQRPTSERQEWRALWGSIDVSHRRAQSIARRWLALGRGSHYRDKLSTSPLQEHRNSRNPPAEVERFGCVFSRDAPYTKAKHLRLASLTYQTNSRSLSDDLTRRICEEAEWQ
jgi:hypothetical protein